MGPCLCLAIINLLPLIGACSGFKVLPKSCDWPTIHTNNAVLSALDPPCGNYPRET